MKNKKHNHFIDDYDTRKSKHLERLATKSLRDDDKYKKLKGKPLNGDFLDNF